MTREEAIKGLKYLRKEFSGYKPNEDMFDMAIEALEAPPNDNWEGYSSRLWKNAYERGKADAEQISALDKAREEIAAYGSIFVRYIISGRTDSDIDAIVEDVLKQAKAQVLAVIDKYRAESEDNNG